MNRKIKLLFIISNINIGGPQKSLLALLDNIDYSKFDVSLCSLNPHGTLKNYYNENITFIKTPSLLYASTLPKKDILSSLIFFLRNKKYSMFFDALRSIFKYVFTKENMNQQRQKFWKKYNNTLPKIDGNYDLSFGILGLSTYAVVDLVDSNKKYHWIRSDTRILNRNEKIDNEYYKKIDGSLSVSTKTKSIFEDIYPFMRGKIDVFNNHIPISLYNKLSYDKSLMEVEEETIKLITITRLDPLKGIEFAIEACAILVEKGYKVKWFILGGGKYENKVREKIKEKHVENHVILLGFQLNTLMFIKDADIFVHPSRTEGKSNAVDEAKYMKKPIVVTNYDTVGDQIIHNYNGLISNMDGKDIALSIIKIIENKGLKNELISNTRSDEGSTSEITLYFKRLLNEGTNYDKVN